jgi:hypothetical protein
MSELFALIVVLVTVLVITVNEAIEERRLAASEPDWNTED